MAWHVNWASYILYKQTESQVSSFQNSIAKLLLCVVCLSINRCHWCDAIDWNVFIEIFTNSITELGKLDTLCIDNWFQSNFWQFCELTRQNRNSKNRADWRIKYQFIYIKSHYRKKWFCSFSVVTNVSRLFICKFYDHRFIIW